MTKHEFMEALFERGNLSLKEAEIVVNTMFKMMTETLRNGDRIELRGFGSFKIKDYESYMGRNPKTGERIQVKAKKMPFFKVGRELRSRVDGK
jgi:integration host factor subunit beta